MCYTAAPQVQQTWEQFLSMSIYTLFPGFVCVCALSAEVSYYLERWPSLQPGGVDYAPHLQCSMSRSSKSSSSSCSDFEAVSKPTSGSQSQSVCTVAAAHWFSSALLVDLFHISPQLFWSIVLHILAHCRTQLLDEVNDSTSSVILSDAVQM